VDITKVEQNEFEEILICKDPSSGLKAIIAIHNTHLGPALGGIRMHPYPNDAEALHDVMRLAKAMSYKSAAAHLKLGGGKSVIFGNPAKDKTPELLKSMGEFIDSLSGRYYSAKDVGITTKDLAKIAEKTKFVTGLPENMGGSGDPSYWTARGVLEGMRACLKEKLNREDFEGIVVAVQGVGHVGYALAKQLHKEKANIIVSDVNKEMLKQTAQELNAEILGVDEIFSAPCDIFAPCAMGGAINDRSLHNLKCKILAGSANNQLENPEKHGEELFHKNILYAPDYIINAGGVINIYVRDILQKMDSMPGIKKIDEHLTKIFELSKKKNIPPSQIANNLAEEILFGKALGPEK